MQKIIGHLIDDTLVSSDSSRTQPVFDPATGAIRAEVALADASTVGAAIASAEQAFPAWRNTPALKRARIMARFRVLLEEQADVIAALITAEHGKVLSDAHGELQRGIENVEYASYAPELLKGEHTRNVGPGIDSWAEHQALGAAGHQVLAVEMEGAAVAQVCRDYGLPFAAVRTISDRADDSAHVDFPHFVRHVASRYADHIIQGLLRAMPGGR